MEVSCQVDLYIENIGTVSDMDRLPELWPERRARVQRYLREEDRARGLLGGLLLRDVLGVCREDQLAYGPHGKPCLKDGGRHFNLSHAGAYTVLAVADCGVGVDIEPVRPFEDAAARRCLTKEEYALLPKGGQEEFFRLWTAKESVMKLSGAGLFLPPESFSVLPIREGKHFIRGQQIYLTWKQWDGHILCVATAGKRKLHYHPDTIL